MAKELDVLFTEEEEAQIVKAIRDAEVTTSGEIRVHISQTEDPEPLASTKQIFHDLRMDNTKDRNGVLLHISVTSKTFAVYGDVGINAVVPANFWESTKTIIQNNFRNGKMVEGICQGVAQIGEQLQAHFPWNRADTNELSDDISYD